MSLKSSANHVVLIASVIVLALVAAGLAATFSPSAVAAQSTSSVTVADYSFTPQTIVVVVGVNNTVVWTNNGPHVHTVAANDNSFASEDLSVGSNFTHTFTVPGNYSYHCSIHTFMKGTVIVEGAATASSTTSNPATLTTPPPLTTTSVTTSSSSPPTSTPSGSSGIPEFPYEALAVTTITIVVLASYLVARQTLRPRSVS
jgi:plastocyanin